MGMERKSKQQILLHDDGKLKYLYFSSSLRIRHVFPKKLFSFILQLNSVTLSDKIK